MRRILVAAAALQLNLPCKLAFTAMTLPMVASA